MKEKIAIGKILKPHGVKGEFIFLSYSGIFKISTYSQLYLYSKQEYLPVKPTKVGSYKKNKNWFLVQLEKIDRNFLDFARGAEIFIDELPYASLKEGEFFYRDLEGCEVFYQKDYLGRVIAVHNFSGPDLVEVEYFEKEKNRTRCLFLPLKDPFLKDLDLNNKKIVFEEIDGFL